MLFSSTILTSVPLGLLLGPKGGVHVDLHEFSPAQRSEDLARGLSSRPTSAGLSAGS